MIVPVAGSRVALSKGASANVKIPPAKPVTVAIAPSQVGVNSNEESSSNNVVTSIISEVDSQFPFVVYVKPYVIP